MPKKWHIAAQRTMDQFLLAPLQVLVNTQLEKEQCKLLMYLQYSLEEIRQQTLMKKERFSYFTQPYSAGPDHSPLVFASLIFSGAQKIIRAL